MSLYHSSVLLHTVILEYPTHDSLLSSDVTKNLKLALRARTQVIRDVKDHFVRKSRLVPETPVTIKYAAETAFASMENVSAAMDSRVIVVRRVRSQHR